MGGTVFSSTGRCSRKKGINHKRRDGDHGPSAAARRALSHMERTVPHSFLPLVAFDVHMLWFIFSLLAIIACRVLTFPCSVWVFLKRGAYPSPLNYHGFPKSCCTSVNEVICHGIPDDRALRDGDIINLDITVYLDGYHGDCSEMFVAGECDEKARDLLQTTYDCWISACQFVAPNRHYKDLGGIIEDYVASRGYSTVRNFCGHGIGSTFHTTPNILHYRNAEPNGQMAPGHTFTVEPMICEGSARALTWPDEWTATTVDGKRSAQFEHTLLVTEDGVEALTGKTEDSPLQFWERDSSIHRGVWLGTSEDAKRRQDSINMRLLNPS